jgi:endoglucanase
LTGRVPAGGPPWQHPRSKGHDIVDEASFTFLRRLLDAPGPSGFERAPARVWREEAQGFADEVWGDVLGNSFARLTHKGGPKVVIEGHIDEIGFLITHIDEEGFLWFDQIGGWDDAVVVGQRIRIVGRDGDVLGVVGRKAAHLVRREDKDKPVETKDLWIDVGAKDRADAKRRVAVGDPAVIDAGFVRLTDDLCVSRSMDNRVGAFVALEAARLLAAERPLADVYAIATTQEEVSFAGAFTASFQVAPMVAIAIDVTHSTDYPNANKKADGEVKLGGGPVLSRGASLNPVVYDELLAASQRLGLECPVQGAARSSGTDADALIRSGAGTATGLVSIPNRYMHSPNEVVSLADLENAARLIAGFVRTVTADSDFRP